MTTVFAMPTNVQHRCQRCERVFQRAEHLARHILTRKFMIGRLRTVIVDRFFSDTGVTPYSCTFCGQRYQRQDVLRRHMANSCVNRKGISQIEEGVQGWQRARTRLACDQCHNKKLKCNGKSPCQKCASRTASCTYGRKTRRRLSAHPTSLFDETRLSPESRPTQQLSVIDECAATNQNADFAGYSISRSSEPACTPASIEVTETEQSKMAAWHSCDVIAADLSTQATDSGTQELSLGPVLPRAAQVDLDVLYFASDQGFSGVVSHGFQNVVSLYAY